MDGGRTFSTISPEFFRNGHVTPDDFDIISTSPKEQGRVYAHVYVGMDKAICRSEDYGDHFEFMAEQASFVVESNSNPSRLYGFGDKGLMISRDGGLSWRVLEGGKDLFSPLYRNQGSMPFRTRSLKELEVPYESVNAEWYSPCWLRQIEVDPHDANVLYVICVKGLYRSTNGGESFRLLPLVPEQYRGIAKMAIDPLDSSILYAVVGTSLLFRSQDAGCTWAPVKLPERVGDGR